MNCPVCQYPNAKGATHCGMCYEVFNRSAAQNYLHAVKKERRQTEGIPEEPIVEIKPEKVVDEARSVAAKIDWQALRDFAVPLLKKSLKPVLIAVSAAALWMIATFLLSASLWFHIFGRKLAYDLPAKAPTQYLVSLKQHVKSWSERGERLDTPMEESRIDEMGNLLLVKKPSTFKNKAIFQVTAKEWIQLLTDAAGSASHSLPKNHPSLAGGKLVFDDKGVLLERRLTLSPRLAKSLPFLTPRFPKGSLRRGQNWEEQIEWLDVYGDWKIYWSGTLQWTLGDLAPCGDDTCATLTYTAELRPQLRGGPSWIKGASRGISGTSSTEGMALFDINHKLLLSNTFAYDGLLHIPIVDLGRIPWELRIGRRVKGPGEILIRFDNKIDIRKN